MTPATAADAGTGAGSTAAGAVGRRIAGAGKTGVLIGCCRLLLSF